MASKKRPADREPTREIEAKVAKRQRQHHHHHHHHYDISGDVVKKAHKFKVFYEAYETLHHEVAALENPPRSKVEDLLEMRERLKTMKTEIYRECPPERA